MNNSDFNNFLILTNSLKKKKNVENTLKCVNCYCSRIAISEIYPLYLCFNTSIFMNE